MPSPREVLEGLTAVSNEWRVVAIAWHVLLGTLLVSLRSGYRPSKRATAVCLAFPLASVSVLAWVSGNPFNGLMFTVASLILGVLGMRSPADRVRVEHSASMMFGVVLAAFGWVYPHFLQAGDWTAYLYAAPLGVVPCPTLSAIVGVTLMTNGLGSRPWCAALSTFALLYGLVGVLFLGVATDWFLVAGAVLLLAQATMTASFHEKRRWLLLRPLEVRRVESIK